MDLAQLVKTSTAEPKEKAENCQYGAHCSISELKKQGELDYGFVNGTLIEYTGLYCNHSMLSGI